MTTTARSPPEKPKKLQQNTCLRIIPTGYYTTESKRSQNQNKPLGRNTKIIRKVRLGIKSQMEFALLRRNRKMMK